jgi:hypothetical protein
VTVRLDVLCMCLFPGPRIGCLLNIMLDMAQIQCVAHLNIVLGICTDRTVCSIEQHTCTPSAWATSVFDKVLNNSLVLVRSK